MPRKYSISIEGHRTSYSIEPEFHTELERLAHEAGISVSALVTQIDAHRSPDTSLSSEIRLHVLAQLRARNVPANR